MRTNIIRISSNHMYIFTDWLLRFVRKVSRRVRTGMEYRFPDIFYVAEVYGGFVPQGLEEVLGRLVLKCVKYKI